MRIRRLPALLLAAATVTGPVALAGAAPAAAHGSAAAATAAPYCGIRWGSLPEQDFSRWGGTFTDVRTGRHACFDRLVLDFSGGDAPGYSVRYVDQVRRDGSGHPVPVRGGARLEVVAVGDVLPMDSIFLPDGSLADTRGYRTFRDVQWAGAFEGQVTVGLGVRARLPFRVLALDGPGNGSRLVVDVAHRW